MLSQGKAEIQNAKATIEKTVNEAKAIYSELAGLWDWVKGLFGAPKKNSAAPASAQKAVPKPSRAVAYKPKPVEQLTYEEYQTQAIHKTKVKSSYSNLVKRFSIRFLKR